MAKNNIVEKAIKIDSKPLTLNSVSDMNELLIKAASLIEYYRLFLKAEPNSRYELSKETAKELFKMFNKATYQDVMIFRYLLEIIFFALDDERFCISDELSNGDYYYDLIWDRIRQ